MREYIESLRAIRRCWEDGEPLDYAKSKRGEWDEMVVDGSGMTIPPGDGSSTISAS